MRVLAPESRWLKAPLVKPRAHCFHLCAEVTAVGDADSHLKHTPKPHVFSAPRAPAYGSSSVHYRRRLGQFLVGRSYLAWFVQSAGEGRYGEREISLVCQRAEKTAFA